MFRRQGTSDARGRRRGHRGQGDGLCGRGLSRPRTTDIFVSGRLGDSFLSVKYLEELCLVVSGVGGDVFLARVGQQLTAINGDGSQD